MDSRPIRACHIMLVGPEEDCTAINGVFTGNDLWRCLRAHSATEALWHLRRESTIDAVLVVPGADLEAYADLTRHLKFGQSRHVIPVVFLLDPTLADRRMEAYEAGADDCIRLPAPPKEIRLRLLNVVRIKRAADSLENATAVISSLAQAIEGRDSYTCGHVERVATYAVEIAKGVGVDEEALSTIRIGGVVHDIGKVVVPDQVLNKPGKLSDEEMEIIHRHPVVGYDILKPLQTMQDVLPIVRWHHERPNGKGYPDALAGDDLPLFPRIMAVADCFDALSTDRPYRPAMCRAECRKILTKLADEGDLDPDLVRALYGAIKRDNKMLIGAGV